MLTHAFDEIQAGAGVSVLAPIHDAFPLVLSTGAYGRWSDDARGVEPGIAAAIFWGGRSYNFHSRYGISAGLLAQVRFGLGGSKETAVVLAAQLNLALLALPFVYLFEAAKGPSLEAAPVPHADRRRDGGSIRRVRERSTGRSLRCDRRGLTEVATVLRAAGARAGTLRLLGVLAILVRGAGAALQRRRVDAPATAKQTLTG